MRYGLVASDFDDTLLRSDQTVSERTLEAVRAFQKAGGIFVIVTGRMTSSIVQEAKKLGLSGLVVAFGGAHIAEIDSGKTVSEHPVPSARAVRIASELEAKGLQVQTYLGPDLLVREETKWNRAYAKACGVVPVVIGEPVSAYLSRTGRSPYKVLAFAEPETVRAEIERINRNYPDLYACYSKPYFIEVTVRGADKAAALRDVAHRFGIPMERTAAVGDSNNDLPMIRAAGLGAAVGNAAEEVRACADLVLPSNDEDGVAVLIRTQCLSDGEEKEE